MRPRPPLALDGTEGRLARMAFARRRPLAAALLATGCSGVIEIGSSGGASTSAAAETTVSDGTRGTCTASSGSASASSSIATGSGGPGGSATTGADFPYGPCPNAACPKDPAEACLADEGVPPGWSVCATVCQTARDCPLPASGDASPACDLLSPGLPRLTGCLLPCGPDSACPDGMACVGAAGLGTMVCAWPGKGP